MGVCPGTSVESHILVPVQSLEAKLFHTNQPVALKLMANADEWQREIDMRKLDGDEDLDQSHVVPVLEAVVLQPGDIAACTE